LASPEDTFDFDGDDESKGELALGSVHSSVLAMNDQVLRAARRELRWFHSEMHGRVPAVGEAPAHEVAAASRIAGWLSELLPKHRGAFVVRYDGRRWPARMTREFGGLTSVVVRFAAMHRQRGTTETLAEAEQAAVTELLADIAAASRSPDFTPRRHLGGHAKLSVPFAIDPAKKLRRLQRAAQNYVRRAELAYLDARGNAPCAVHSASLRSPPRTPSSQSCTPSAPVPPRAREGA
jgi:hypothetical protein